ncbi:MAG: TetR family transcriptional regulator, partial [Candidatus Binatus sp.]
MAIRTRAAASGFSVLCNPKVLTLIRRGINQPLKLLSNAIAEAQGSGRLQRTLNPEAAARVLIAMFHGL